MHETGVIRNIFEKALGHNAKKITVKLGALKSVPEDYFMELFHELAKGTELENVEIKIETAPLRLKCGCGFEGEIKDVPHIHFSPLDWPCPECGKRAEIVTGNEQEISFS